MSNSILNTIQSINGTVTVLVSGTKVDGTAFTDRKFTLNSADQKVEDTTVLQEVSDKAFKSLKTANITSISIL